MAHAGRRGRGEQPSRPLQVHPGGGVGSAALAQHEGQVHDLVHALEQGREVGPREVEPMGLDPIAVGGDGRPVEGDDPPHGGVGQHERQDAATESSGGPGDGDRLHVGRGWVVAIPRLPCLP